MSLPVWERGLKCVEQVTASCSYNVAPRVGAWIEIQCKNFNVNCKGVAPRVGAWIEIYDWGNVLILALSLPVWERGLKFYYDKEGHKQWT